MDTTKITLATEKWISRCAPYFLGAVFLYFTYCFIITLLNTGVNDDACYYLGISQSIDNGLVPFADFHLEYTPLSFYIVFLLSKLGIEGYEYSLAFLFLLTYVNSFFVYRLSYKYTKSQKLSLLCGLLFLGVNLMWGTLYELEPFVLVFGLPSLLVISEKNYTVFISGFLNFCSFWCKQYGLGFVFLCAVLLLLQHTSKRETAKRLLLLLSGFLAGALLLIGFLILNGVGLNDMLHSLSGGDYDKRGFSTLFEAYSIIIKVFPALIVCLIIVACNYRKLLQNKLVVVSMFGIGGFMLQCYVRFYAHYLLLVVPFICLFIIGTYDLISKKHRFLFDLLLVLTIAIPLFFCTRSLIQGKSSSSLKETQIVNADIVGSYIPKNSINVFAAQKMMYVSYLNSYTPPLLKKYGMSNGFLEDPSEIHNLCVAADYCIIDDFDNLNKKRFSEDTKEYLETHFRKEEIVDNEGNYICCLYTRIDK